MKRMLPILLASLLLASCVGRGSSDADKPRFEWRGVHFDVSRHFFPLDFIKKQIDVLSGYGINVLHLHLTDAAGWRMECKAFPELTEQTAWRPYPDWKAWDRGGRCYCTREHPDAQGGYYTQEELRSLVAYAAERGITVVPEIEMPGHSEEVAAVFPELTLLRPGEDEEALQSLNERLLTFYQTVLLEVMEVFPSPYIHIGGDETDYPLQHTFIAEMARFVQKHGRRAVAWDEVLCPSLPRDVVVMIWHGMDKAQDAVRQGYDVVLTPGAWCYLDHYQDAMFAQPEAIGGYTPLEKVCAFRPLEGLTDEEASHILGVQGNVWTEYISTQEHFEQMLYPRIIALAEIGRKGSIDDYPAFRIYALREVERLRAAGIHAFDLAHEVGQRPESLTPLHHLAEGCKVRYNVPWSPYYAAAEAATLTDGWCGGWHHGDGRWQGFIPDGLDVCVELGEPKQVDEVYLTFYNSPGVEIFLPAAVQVNGQEALPVGGAADEKQYGLVSYKAVINAELSEIHVTAQHNARRGWLFVDEIVVK
jgi:hexosaminidase